MKYIIALAVIFIIACSQKRMPDDYWPYDVVNGYVKCTDIECFSIQDEGMLFSKQEWQTNLLCQIGVENHLLIIPNHKMKLKDNQRAVDLLTAIKRGESGLIDIGSGYGDSSQLAPPFKDAIKNYHKNLNYKRQRLSVFVRKEQYRNFEWKDFYFSIVTDQEQAAIDADAAYKSSIWWVMDNWKKAFTVGGWSPVGDSSIMIYDKIDTVATLFAYKNKTFKIIIKP